MVSQDGLFRLVRLEGPLRAGNLPEPDHSRLLAVVQIHVHHSAELAEESRDGINGKFVHWNTLDEDRKGPRIISRLRFLCRSRQLSRLPYWTFRGDLLLLGSPLLLYWLLRRLRTHFLHSHALVHLLLLLHHRLLLGLLHLLVISYCGMQLLFNGDIGRVQLRLLLYMEQCVHEALLIGRLIRTVWDDGLRARL